MALFIITYDLIKTKDYKSLWGALENLGAHRILESVWLLSYDSTTGYITKWLKDIVDQDDRILVAEIEPEKLGFNNAKAGSKNWISLAKEEIF